MIFNNISKPQIAEMGIPQLHKPQNYAQYNSATEHQDQDLHNSSL